MTTTPWRPRSAHPTPTDLTDRATADQHYQAVITDLLTRATSHTDPARCLTELAALDAATRGSGFTAALRDAKIAQAHRWRAQGATWPDIARRLGIAVTSAHRLAASAPRHADAFDDGIIVRPEHQQHPLHAIPNPPGLV